MNKTIACTFLVVLASAATLQAQIVISGSFPSKLAAGPDYATDVLSDPWDMSNAEDIGLDPAETVNWTTFSVAGGLAGGRTATTDTQLSLLFSGFYGLINPGKNGRNFPIDTSKYRKLSFRMSSNFAGAPQESTQVYWFHTPWLDPSDAAVAPDFDRNFGVALPGQTVNGFKVFVADMTAGNQGNAWINSPVRGLRIDPNNNNSGQDVFFDWVRLTLADGAAGAAVQAISWTGGTATIDVMDAGLTVLPIASNQTSPYNWYYGILPPGSYTLRVCSGNWTDCTGHSPALKAFTINNPPTIQVTDPSPTTGQDFATTVLGNPWDMSGPPDVQFTGSENFTPTSPFDFTSTPGMLNGTSTNSDPNVTLLYNTNHQIPIDTSKYRYFTYRLQVDGPYNLANGSVARVFWGSQQFLNPDPNVPNATTSKDIIVWPGMNTYTFDLATLSSGPDGGLETFGAGEAWTAANKRHLRFDPHEFGTNFPEPRGFHLDDVKLTAMPVSTGTFTIQFAGSDADGDGTTVNLYYDIDLDPAVKTAIPGASGISLSAGQHVWNTAGVPANPYYIYAEVTDGLNTIGHYSAAPVQVGGATVITAHPASQNVAAGQSAQFTAAATGNPSPGFQWQASTDNGASWTNLSESAPYSGTITPTLTVTAAGPLINRYRFRVVATNAVGAATSGSATLTVRTVAGNIDGDGKADLAIYRPSTAGWLILRSGANYTTNTMFQFGLSTDVPVPGDYDGDGKMDFAVWRPSTGVWHIRQSSTNYTTTATLQWGLSTDIAVPGDYDGDGKMDPTVYRPRSGVWYILQSTTNYTIRATVALGLSTDIPVPADYDGDGTMDVAVYRQSSGMWYVRKSSTGGTTSLVLQWGLNGDVPVPGDYDGDGISDPAVYRPANGIWFILQSTTNYTTSASFQWGLSGDLAVPSDYDGDGKIDPTVYRPANGTWYILQSTAGYAAAATFQWGLGTDSPTPNLAIRSAVAAASGQATVSTLANLARGSDFDGDARADLTVYRPSNGTWFTRQSITNYGTFATFQWGLSGDIPVPGDFDGDGITDFAVYRPASGEWYIRQSSTGNATFVTFQWGLSGDVPVPGDYDGDGKTDIAVYRPPTGVWYIRQSTTNFATFVTFQWGLGSDVTVPGDYDGDGITDLAVWRPSTGVWYVRQSTTNYTTNVAFQWGLDTDIAVPGDFDGDGKTDFAVYRPSTGVWFIRQSTTNSTTFVSYQLGLSTDTPVPGDFDGDGRTDLAVHRPATATWYLLTSSTNFTAPTSVQWGLSGDIPILQRP